MSALLDANTRAACANARDRVLLLLQAFVAADSSWDDLWVATEFTEPTLEHLKIDLSMLNACIEQRLQETYQTHEPTEFGS